MRVLLIMRGLPGCGKSTWIKNNGLEAYTLCADTLRLLYSSPVQLPDGGITISQDNGKQIWDLLLQLLERRMQRGEFTIVDAHHCKVADFAKYKHLAEQYHYRVYCIDFTNVPIEVAKERNRTRGLAEPWRFVPEDYIDKKALAIKNTPPSFVTVLDPENALDTIFYHPVDFSEYKKIHHIGDIHGCYTALLEYFYLESYGFVPCSLEELGNHEDHDFDGGLIWAGIKLRSDELFIFLGDYTDRGIQNVRTLNFMMKIADLPNVILLEGNHERWPWMWANDNEAESKSKEFNTNTRGQLEAGGIDKREVRIFYRKLRQVVYYTYHGKKILVSHGGLATMPRNLVLLSSDQLIRGVGTYHDRVNDVFGRLHPDIIQIHGHRNIPHDPIQINDTCFNLCDRVEHGENLRVLILDENGFTPKLIKNVVFRKE